jgi:iron complex outermembrane receptor protein
LTNARGARGKTVKSLFIPFCIATLGCVSAANAADEVLFANNPATIEVTSTRFETSIESAPVNISVITSEAIEKSTATTLSQLLKNQTGIQVKELFGISGSRSQVDMGGFGATGELNTLIIINGRRLNDVDISGANLAAIPLEGIDRIEIMHGSASVLYGDNAVSGVINIVTKSGFQESKPSVTLQGGSFGSHGVAATLAGSKNNDALHVAINAAHSDGYRDNSAFDSASLMGEWTHQHENALFGMRLNGSYEDLELPGEVYESDFEENPQSGTGTIEFSRESVAGIEGFYSDEHLAGELAYREKRQKSFVYGEVESDLDTLSFRPRINYPLGSHTIISGVDLYQSTLEATADFGLAVNSSDAQRESVAIYLSDTLKLSDKISVNLGARHHWITLDISNRDLLNSITTTEKSSDDLGAWDIGLSYHHQSGGKSYLRYARSFRFPVLDESYNYFSGTIATLKPQTGKHIEAGTSFPVNRLTHLDINLFHIDNSDEIGFDINTYSNINLDPTRHIGINLNIQTLLMDSWTLQAGYTYRDATFTSGQYKDNTIPEIPTHKINISNLFQLTGNSNLSLDAIYTGARYFGDDYANQGKKMPAYTWVDAGYNLTVGSWKFAFSIKNLTDVNAADQGYYRPFHPELYAYYPLPERSYYLSVRKEF